MKTKSQYYKTQLVIFCEDTLRFVSNLIQTTKIGCKDKFDQFLISFNKSLNQYQTELKIVMGEEEYVQILKGIKIQVKQKIDTIETLQKQIDNLNGCFILEKLISTQFSRLQVDKTFLNRIQNFNCNLSTFICEKCLYKCQNMKELQCHIQNHYDKYSSQNLEHDLSQNDKGFNGFILEKQQQKQQLQQLQQQYESEQALNNYMQQQQKTFKKKYSQNNPKIVQNRQEKQDQELVVQTQEQVIGISYQNYQQNVLIKNVQETLENGQKQIQLNCKKEEKFFYTCIGCQKTFQGNRQYRSHLKIFHDKKQFFCCGYCTKSFLKPYSLASHCFKEHTTLLQNYPMSSIFQKHMYTCVYTYKEFTQQLALANFILKYKKYHYQLPDNYQHDQENEMGLLIDFYVDL